MANSIFVTPFGGTVQGDIIVTGAVSAGDGTAALPSHTFAAEPSTGMWRSTAGVLAWSTLGADNMALSNSGFAVNLTHYIGWASGAASTTAADVKLVRDTTNVLALKNGTAAQTFRNYGYSSGSRLTYQSITCVTTAVSVSGASTGTGNVIPAGATVVEVATSTTTVITGATGYTVGDGTDVDRFGDITGTAVGTNSGSTNYTADPRWWTAAARAITLTAKTSNFISGVVQVTVFYTSATGA